MKRLNNKGFSIVLATIIGGVMSIVIVSMSRILLSSSTQGTYFKHMDLVFRLAETGLNEAIGNLSRDPAFYDGAQNGAVVYWNGSNDDLFQNYVSDSQVVDGGYYVVTVASRTKGGKVHAVTLHSHIRISNAGEYFWAVNGLLMLARGTDAATGKVYARDLQFITAGTGVTQIKKAEYLNELTPPTSTPNIYDGTVVNVVDSPFEPVQLSASVVFPQVLDSDIDLYKDLAHIDFVGGPKEHEKCDFTVDTNVDTEIHLFPPGYAGTYDVTDDYPNANHTAENKDHTYFCPGEISIGTMDTTIHGQILFVATGTIFIKGNIENYDQTSASDYPGEGNDPVVNKSSSVAHQAVLITPGDVIITDDYFSDFDPNNPPANARLQTIEGLILAPHGTMRATAYTDTLPNHAHDSLALKIHGSMILNQIENNLPNNFGNVFLGDPDGVGGLGPRTYEYMDSLADKPPPDLPALAEIFYSLESTN